MAVLRPIRVRVSNFAECASSSGSSGHVFEVPDFPFDPSLGSHHVTLEDNFYIDGSDFRVVDDADYFGLAPGKAVLLKYSNVAIRCESFETNEKGTIAIYI
jgi:glutaminyl-tRNA synthetase